MTQAQWFWEYLALREKEKEQHKLTVETITDTLKALKIMLVSILGLNLIPGVKKEGEEDKDFIIPLSLIAGRRDAVELIFKKMNEEEEINKALEDEEFERLSQAMAKDEDLGDMEPLINMSPEEEQQLTDWFNPARLRELQRMGINVTETPHKPTVHIDVDTDNIKQKMADQAKARIDASKQIEKEFERDRKELGIHKNIVTFDDDEDG
jgi:hypothetical protein